MVKKNRDKKSETRKRNNDINKVREIETESRKNTVNHPSQLTTAIVLLIVLVVSIVSAALTSVIIGDLLTSLTVFIFTLLVLAIVVPYLGLSTGLLTETSWFQTYIIVMKRIPGLEVVIDAILENIGRS